MGNTTSQTVFQAMFKLRAPLDSPNRATNNISEDILIHILSFVPPQDLINSCSKVCHQWKSLVNGHSIWKRKCEREGKIIPKCIFKTIPEKFYRNICLHDPYGRNLLKNPHGAEELKHWVVEGNGGDGWLVEDPPGGADPVPSEAGGQSCFATSYGKCQKYQEIDLRNEGINTELLDEAHPGISVGEWHAARFDCGSLYSLKVVLLGADHSEIDVFEYGPFTEEQWAGRAWTKAEYVFRDYSPGVRYIGFEHWGKDTQFWAGHYGSKMTGGYVKFVWEN